MVVGTEAERRVARLSQHLVVQPVSSGEAAPPSKSDYFGIDDLLTEEEKRIRYRTREFAEKNVLPIIVPFWEKAEFPMALVESFKELKLGGTHFKGYGCAGISTMATAMMVIELSRIDTSVSTFWLVHNCLGLASIGLLGSEEQKKRFLPPMAKLEKIGSFGLTEPLRGSDASHLLTTAKPVEGGYIINGEKRWIGNATWADVCVVWAVNTETKQVEGFIVEKGMKGFNTSKIENKMSLRVVQNADIVLKDCFVPSKNRLEKATNFSNGVGRVLMTSRVIVAWQPVGVAMGIFDHCLQYLKQRKQFNAPLAAFQLNQEKLARMCGTIQGMILVAWRLTRLLEQGNMTNGQASMAKAINTLRGREVAALGRELLGGNGIVTDFHVGRLFCDMESLHSYEGTYDINMLVAARELTGFASFKAPLGMKK